MTRTALGASQSRDGPATSTVTAPPGNVTIVPCAGLVPAQGTMRLVLLAISVRDQLATGANDRLAEKFHRLVVLDAQQHVANKAFGSQLIQRRVIGDCCLIRVVRHLERGTKSMSGRFKNDGKARSRSTHGHPPVLQSDMQNFACLAQHNPHVLLIHIDQIHHNV